MRRVRVVQGFSVVGAAVLIALATLGSTAGATTATGTDPLHDNGPGFDARGDVTAFSVDYGSTITVSTTTAAFDDPETSPSWIVQLTDIAFWIDTNNDGAPDYYVDYENNLAGGVDVGVWDTARHFLCGGTASFDAAASSYSAAFPASCIGSPASLEMAVQFDYVTTEVQSHDLTAFTAPATGPSTTTTSTLPGATTTTSVPETTTTNDLPPATTTTIPETTTTFVVDVLTPTTSTSSTTVVKSATSPTTVAAASATLPFTGSSAIALTLVAFCLIGAGAGLARQRRRTR